MEALSNSVDLPVHMLIEFATVLGQGWCYWSTFLSEDSPSFQTCSVYLRSLVLEASPNIDFSLCLHLASQSWRSTDH